MVNLNIHCMATKSYCQDRPDPPGCIYGIAFIYETIVLKNYYLLLHFVNTQLYSITITPIAVGLIFALLINAPSCDLKFFLGVAS